MIQMKIIERIKEERKKKAKVKKTVD